MKYKKFRIKNYKAIKDLTIELERVLFYKQYLHLIVIMINSIMVIL